MDDLFYLNRGEDYESFLQLKGKKRCWVELTDVFYRGEKMHPFTKRELKAFFREHPRLARQCRVYIRRFTLNAGPGGTTFRDEMRPVVRDD